MVVPVIFEKLIALEKWDYSSQQVNQHIWRVYLTKLFGLFIVYFLNIYYILLGKTSKDLFGDNLFNFKMDYSCPSDGSYVNQVQNSITASYINIYTTNYNNCREDQVLINLVSQVMIYIFINVRLLWISCKEKY